MRRELTTVLIPNLKKTYYIIKVSIGHLPSFLLTILNGLKALRARNPLTNEISKPEKLSRIQVSNEKPTMMKSRTFQLSFKYVFSPQ